MVITNFLLLLSVTVCEPVAVSGALSLYMHPRRKYVNYPTNRNVVCPDPPTIGTRPWPLRNFRCTYCSKVRTVVAVNLQQFKLQVQKATIQLPV